MRFLIVGSEFMWTSLAFRLQELEGEDVRIFCAKKEGKEHLQGVVEQVPTLGAGLAWVKRDGYILSEDEADMSALRKMGFKVLGGNAWTKRIENDRQFEMSEMKKAGLNIPNYHHIKSVDEGIKFIKAKPDRYALKQEGHLPKTWNFVGGFDDGKDVIEQLEWIKLQPEFKKESNIQFTLQEFIDGLEFAVGAWWQYEDWLRDSDGKILTELNREHKKQGEGDTGLSTGEMGTVMRFADEGKFFEQTLEKLTPVLQKYAKDVALNIDCNCGITDDGKAWLMESTPRTGYPACALQEYMMEGDAGDFYRALIDGKDVEEGFKKTWGVVTVVGSGQFPDESDNHEGSFKDQPVRFPDGEPGEHIAPFYLKLDKEGLWRIADHYEYVAGVCFDDTDIAKANEQCVAMMEEINVRAIHFRRDIGTEFHRKEIPQLTKMGFL